MAELTQTRLREVLSYDLKTGIFRWKKLQRMDLIGTICGKINPNGYRQIKVDQRYYYARRLAFLYVLGRWPVGQADHKNRKKDDNRWKNLRDATPAQNSQNAYKRCTGRSGHRWVYPTRAGKFMVLVKDQNKQVYLGTFETKIAAANAAIIAIKRRHGKFAALEG